MSLIEYPYVWRVRARLPEDIKKGEDMNDTAKIPTLYFDEHGNGPDHLYLEVFPIRADSIMPPTLSLRVRPGSLVIRAQVDGGYFMQREQVVALREALDAWLLDNP